MTTLKALKSRTEGIEKISKIARAMEVIAATNLHRQEEQALQLRPYLAAQQSIIQHLASSLKRLDSLWARPDLGRDKALAILIGSDRGFCGGFNLQLFQLVKGLGDAREFSFIAIGKKGARFLKKRHLRLIEEFTLPDADQTAAFAQDITKKVVAAYQGQQQRVYLIFNQFRKNLLGRGCLKQILPLEASEEKGPLAEYLFEPDMEATLNKLLPLYVEWEIKAAILESRAAEEMARMVAMTQASRSAEDLIKSLTLQYHKARQAGITKELVEIASAIR